MQAIDDKTIVKDYFNSKGFDRWRRIYGDGDDISKVQLDIRNGHQKTIDKVLSWLREDGNIAELSVFDAGCGVGSLSIPLAEVGATVYASDISEKMVGEAKERAEKVLPDTSKLILETHDLETVEGKYHTVICLDVLIHYPPKELEQMLGHLASLAESRLILSFAPFTVCLMLLKKVGELFPGPSKTTRAYMHHKFDIIDILEQKGFAIKRKEMIGTRFYFSYLLEAVRKNS
ncbi:magnesium protoporphyrin IX methyltransferase [Spirulina sp. 06S082]|uniref:magnesium protoporphyrin IX methyltransferase n=1 Tax=Spirulina sp. 06S082 TaxID=3110248 RepID=UPI002B1F47FA|nr:magnesium protoporphyrin IX methyltransferase [Spirulina sp. 06S082]MEA5469396.1 magnesium protoporphyrin IX methyltransferase [Spirulina sp. 06S082]